MFEVWIVTNETTLGSAKPGPRYRLTFKNEQDIDRWIQSATCGCCESGQAVNTKDDHPTKTDHNDRPLEWKD